MRTLRGLAELVRAHLIETLRSKSALFWTLAFPLFFLFLFGGVMARGDARAASYMMPGLFTNMLLGGTLFAVAIRIVSERETGVLRRYRVTPVSAVSVVLAHGATAFATQIVTFFLLWGVGRASFGVSVAGSPVTLFLTFLAGVLALLPLGLLVGSVARDSRSAAPIANMLFFPMLFLSGASFPFAFLPDAVQRFARFLPATYVVEALNAVMIRGEGVRALLPTLSVLFAFAAVGITLNAMLFRWEGTDPVPRRSLAIVALGMLLVVGGAAAFSPALRMGRAPWTRSPEAGAAKGQVRVLKGMTVIDGLGGRVENARVTIRDQRITELAPDSSAALPSGAIVEDLSGRYLIPGLIDSHVHLGGSGGVGATPLEFKPEREIRDTQALLACGITTLVSLTDDLRDLGALREAVALGKMRAPRTFFAGPSITAPGGHPSELFSFSPALQERLTRQVATPEAARKAVEELSFRGVDLIKLVLEGGYPGHPLPRMSEETFRAAVLAAHKADLKITVHVGSDADVRLALDAGADGIEHVPADLSDDTIRLMAAKKVTLTPTLDVFDMAARRDLAADALVRRWADPATLASLAAADSPIQQFFANPAALAALGHRFEAGAAVTGRAARAGVPILAGSDSGNPGIFHGPALVHEVELLAERAGLTPTEALAAATSRPADRLGQRELGRIAPQAIADLVVLGSDPTVDIRALRDVRGIYLGGLPLDLAKLLESSPGSWVPGQNN